jgi:hypothetical protein
MWATYPRLAFSGYHAEFHKGCYQKYTNLRCRWPVYKTVELAVRIFTATTRTFTKNTALSEQGRGVAWQGNGMGMS